jgi:hypothetical protein
LGFRPFFPYTGLAVAYAHAGRMDEAKAALHAPNVPAVFDGVRKAGLPEE